MSSGFFSSFLRQTIGDHIMICHFPRGYPEEIFYSICARYSDRMQYRTEQALARDLFGREISAKVIFPNGLGNLVTRLSPNHHYTVDDIIANYTLLPFYQPFLPEDRFSLLKSTMETDEGKQISTIMGVRSRALSSKGYLRFCSHCVDENRRQFGECYWHRVHQIPDVEICPSHGIFLQNSSVPMWNQRNRYKYVSLEKVADRNLCLPTGETSTYRNALLKIAQDSLWLLQNHTLTTSLSSVQSKYFFLLAEHGLGTYTGKVYTSKLLEAFQQYYAKDFLEYIHLEINEYTYENWVSRFLHRSTQIVYQPMCHLLFIHFLGHTIGTFLNLEASERPFGTGPWPCLNPVCDHFQKKHVHQCEITYSGFKAARPRGTFSCECGFTYSRIGPDRKAEDSFRVGRVNTYGPLWETKLRELCEDPSMNTYQAARILGVDFATAKKQAQRRGLSFGSMPNQIVSSQDVQCNESIQPVNEALAALRDKYRMIWLSAREENPGDTIRQIRPKIPGTYIWLYRHDREWLALAPKKKGYAQNGACVEWEQRDRQLALQIRHSALHLKKNSGHPIRVTINSLIHDGGQRQIIYKNRDKLPLTAQALEEVIETSEAFVIRRVQWLAECYQQENVRPTSTQFMTRGSFYLPQARWKSVKDAVDDALRMLGADLA
jgi:Tn7-like transposition protein D/TniQ